MSTINVTLTRDELAAVDKAAEAAGKTRQEFFHDALERHLRSAPSSSAPAKSPKASTTKSSSKDKE